jgi:hypothetical protein
VYIAVSILVQLRDELLTDDFSAAMLIFTDLPHLSVDQIIVDSIKLARITPPSLLSHLAELNIDLGTPDHMKRFSFLSNESLIVGKVRAKELVEMRSMSLVLDIRPQAAYLE